MLIDIKNRNIKEVNIILAGLNAIDPHDIFVPQLKKAINDDAQEALIAEREQEKKEE